MTTMAEKTAGTILIVDDEIAGLQLLSQILSAGGYKVRAVKTGKEALTSIQIELPDLILLDIKLPDISGYTVCETLKSQVFSKNVPVIFLSALNETSEKLHAFSSGGVDYVTKPFIPEEVLARVKTHIEMFFLRSQLETQARELLEKNSQLLWVAEQHKLSDQALARSEEKFRNLFELSSAVKLLIDPINGDILDANNAAIDFYGWSKEQLKQMHIQDINRLPDYKLQDFSENILSTGRGRYEFQHGRADGSTRDVEVFVNTIQSVEKDLIYSIIHDITDRKKAEEALREIEASKREQAAKRRIEAHYATTFSALNDGLWEWHVPSGEAVFSDVYYKMLGYEVNEFPATYSSWRELVHLDDIKRCEEELQTNRESGQGFSVDLRMRMKSGEWKWISLRGKTVESDIKRKPLRMVGTISDISSRKHAERQLTESHDLLNNLARLVPGVIYQYRLFPDGRSAFPYASPGINDIYEMQPEEVREDASPVFSRLHPEDRARVSEAIFQSARTLETFFCEFRVLLPRQGLRWRWSQAQPQPMEDGGTLWHGIISDITDRKRAEEKLRESNEYLENLINYANVPIIVWDMHFRITRFNHAFEKLTGRSASDVLGKSLEILFPRAQVVKSMALIEETLAGERWKDIEIAIQKIDGSVRTVLWNSATILGSDNEAPIAIIAQGTDITERNLAELEKKRLSAQLQQAQKMEAIGTLAGGIAHDFNNILGAILGYAEMAADDCPPGSQLAKDIEQILKAGTRAKELVKQILAFSRQAETERVPLQPAVIINEAIKLLRASLPTTIEIKKDICPDAGVILADPTQIHRIVMNLCTNAFHAMEIDGGTLTISLQRKEISHGNASISQLRPGSYLELSIEDTGMGIAPEVQDKIFDPYFTTKEVGKGTGMGLATVHGIVQSYGGSISYESQPGRGSVFRVTLPTVDTSSQQENESAELIAVGGREHILLIDDEIILVEMGKAMLERLGYRVTTKTNSIEALTTFQNQPDTFDLIITDQTMPGMTGTDLSRRMLQIRPNLPIILCTGYSNIVTEEQTYSFGIKGFAMKPLTKKSIAQLARKVLDSNN
ncbi:MAG: PAS domain S-box protein [Desulforhopalus sp.]|nr:PAS domain S-box protein [Desulforhopalus sp.]